MTMQTRQRVLVTGGAGFLGSHLCQSLLTAGHEVMCLDNFATGRAENLQALSSHPRFTVLRQDVAEPIHLRDVQRIYNLACPASPPRYQADPVATVRTCVLGLMQVMDLASKTGARVLQASTSEVYGDPQVHPQEESYWGHVNPIGPRACYDEGKRCAETLCRDYSRTRGIEVRVARIFNTYGPGMAPDDGRVVSNFMVQALAGQPLTVHGSGDQTRSFCFVSDLIDGLMRLMESDVDGPVNLGNPAEITMLALAELVAEVSGKQIELVFAPADADDPVQRKPDISRARQLLGWTPTIQAREGLAQTLRYFAGQPYELIAPALTPGWPPAHWRRAAQTGRGGERAS